MNELDEASERIASSTLEPAGANTVYNFSPAENETFGVGVLAVESCVTDGVAGGGVEAGCKTIAVDAASGVVVDVTKEEVVVSGVTTIGPFARISPASSKKTATTAMTRIKIVFLCITRKSLPGAEIFRPYAVCGAFLLGITD